MTVVLAAMVPVPKRGNVVAPAAEPSENVPELRLSVPAAVSWNPPSLNTLLPVTSPMVRFVAVVAAVALVA